MADKSVCLVIIDPQRDFIDGSLAIPGGDDDMKRLSKMVRKYRKKITDIQITMDSHYRIHISHPNGWVDKNGNYPVPIFLHQGSTTPTYLTLDMVKKKEFRARNPKFQKRYEDYVKQLEKNNRYQLMIWPEHCIIGSPGWNIHPELLAAISEWEELEYGMVLRRTKGSNPFTEHYSAVKADVIDPQDPTTMLNTSFIETLKQYDKIISGGEALSHCYANTFRDIFNELGEDQVKKFVLLEDATSNVPGCEKMGEDFINEFTSAPYNMKIAKTTNYF